MSSTEYEQAAVDYLANVNLSVCHRHFEYAANFVREPQKDGKPTLNADVFLLGFTWNAPFLVLRDSTTDVSFCSFDDRLDVLFPAIGAPQI